MNILLKNKKRIELNFDIEETIRTYGKICFSVSSKNDTEKRIIFLRKLRYQQYDYLNNKIHLINFDVENNKIEYGFFSEKKHMLIFLKNILNESSNIKELCYDDELEKMFNKMMFNN